MRSRPLRLLLIVSMLSSLGTASAFLQTAAWVSMAAKYVHRDGWSAGLKKTFDGDHPCPICLCIKKASQPGPSLAAVSPERPLAVSPVTPSVAFTLDISWNVSSPVAAPHGRARAPDPRPPQAVLS
jgi:hypothetical protein